MSTYTEQTDKFLADTGTTFSIEYQYTGPYFDDDKEKRDVYTFTLRNARGQYCARFGTSLHDTDRCIEPSAHDVLPCLQKSDVGTFADFCADFDYNVDSIRAQKTYFAVQVEYAALARMYTPAELDQLCEVSSQHWRAQYEGGTK